MCELRLLDDPKYLANLLTKVSESSRPAIKNRLEELKVANGFGRFDGMNPSSIRHAGSSNVCLL